MSRAVSAEFSPQQSSNTKLPAQIMLRTDRVIRDRLNDRAIVLNNFRMGGRIAVTQHINIFLFPYGSVHSKYINM
jgi:hypothetical protein